MEKKGANTGMIILVIGLLILIGIFIVVIGIAIFGGDKEPTDTTTDPEPTDTTTDPEPTDTTTDGSDDAKTLEPQGYETNYSLEDDPNYGKCSPNWPENAAPSQPGYAQGAITQCTKHIEEARCLSVDIYHTITDSFGDTDGIPDCKWEN